MKQWTKGKRTRWLLVATCLFAAVAMARFDPVEWRWAWRESLPSCGTARVLVFEELEEKSEVACLDRALQSGRGAELVVRSSTDEGDPIAEYYRVLQDGSTEVYVDSTADRFGQQKWSYRRCEDPESALDVTC